MTPLARLILANEELAAVMRDTCETIARWAAVWEISSSADAIQAADEGEFDNRLTDLLSDRWESQA